MQLSHKIPLPFWIITIAIFIGIIIPSLIQEGMFMDGLLYLGVSKNLAQGIGTFWEPIFSYTWENSGSTAFHEQPPLGFGIQALFFKIFGYSIYVERFYAFFIASLSALFITKIWKLVNNGKLSNINWLPIIFWITIPISFWAIHNNILENTLSLFDLIATYFLLRGITLNKNVLLNLALGGLFIFLASFTKGVPGLFPMVIIGIYWLVFRSISFKKVVFWSVIPIVTIILIYSIIILTNEDAYNSLSFYFNKRLIGRIGNSPTVDSHFWILWKLFLEILPIFSLSIITISISRYKKSDISPNYKYALFFCLVGLSASLPLTLTLVQRAFYFTAALPYFGLATACIIGPILSKHVELLINQKRKLLRITSWGSMVFALVLSYNNIGKYRRDEAIIKDIKKISLEIPYNTIIKAETNITFHWSTIVYAMRYHNIHLDQFAISEYYLTSKNKKNVSPLYEKVELDLEEFSLYKKVSTE